MTLAPGRAFPDTVAGFVRRTDGTAATGARVTFYRRALSNGKAAVTGADGAFTVRDLAPGYYNIEIAARNFCREYVTRFEVNEAKYGIQPRVFTVFLPGRASGRVTDENGQPLAGARVNDAVADRLGFYRLWWLKPGPSVRIAVRAPGFVNAERTVAVGEQGETGGTDFRLEAGGALAGRVTARDSGRPLKGARVNAWGQASGYTVSDAAGAFRLDGLPAGTYQVEVYLQGYESASAENLVVRRRETTAAPALALQLRPESFYLYDNKWNFGPGEKITLSYNAFRARSVEVAVYPLDPAAEIAKFGEGARDGTVRDRFRQADLAGREPVYRQVHAIRYPGPLSDIYDRQITLPALPTGAWLAVARPENLPEQRQFFLVTDLALLARAGSERTVFFACHLATGAPAPGTGIVLLDAGLQPAGRGVTGPDGLWETGAAWHRSAARQGDAWALLAVDGRPAAGTAGIRTYLYTERPVYRPGQTVYVKGVTRREDSAGVYRPADRASLEVSVADPRGNGFLRRAATVSANGTFDLSFTLPEEPPLGDWRVETEGGSARFQVQEYRKPEFTVSVSPDRAVYLPRETVRALVEARYYFGAPVAGAEVKWSVYRRDTGGYRPDWEDDGDEYGRYGWGYGRQVLAGEAVTGENGRALIEFPLDDAYDVETVYTIEARAIDLSRREVTAAGRLTAAPGAFRIDLSTDKYLYAPGEEIAVSLRLAGHDGQPAAGRTVELVAGTDTARGRDGEFRETFRRALTSGADGRAGVRLAAPAAGLLRLEAQGRDEHHNLVGAQRQVWVGGRGYRASWAGGRRLEAVLDRDRYLPGDTVRVLFNSAVADLPLLVTVERDRIYHREVITLDGHTGFFEFALGPEHAPTVYLSACAVHDNQYYSTVRRVDVSPREHLLEVEVTSDRTEYQPGETVQYLVTTRDFSGAPVPAEVSFGLVDEAIYALSGELVPRIEDFFHGRRPHRVRGAYSFYEWLYAGAGKDGLDEGVRRDFRDTAYWNPRVFTGADGRAQLAVALPDNLTTWRATARGVTAATQAGTAVQKVVSSKPLAARLITPRFLVEGDRFFITGVVHNDTGREIELAAALSGRGLEVMAPAEQRAPVAAGGQARFDWPVRAPEAGQAALILSASAAGVSDALELALPILPYGRESLQTASGQVETAVSDRFSLPAAVRPGSARLETFVYPSLASGLFRNLDYLAGYPYGCVEQTMSRFLPLVYVARALAEIGAPDLAFLAEDQAAFRKMLDKMPDMVNTGLNRLYAAQNEDGGWGWWSRDTSRPYTSAYVYYGLSNARQAGYAVDETRLENARDFLLGILPVVVSRDERAYIVFALDQGGDAPAAARAQLYEQRDEINAYSLALLTLSYAPRDRARAETLIADLYRRMDAPAPGLARWRAEAPGRYGWGNSDIEATAWALRATLALDPKRPEVPAIARYLVWREKGGAWRSTKDTAVCVLALADLLRAGDELSPDYQLKLSVNGQPVAETRVTRQTLRDFSVLTRTPAEFLRPGAENEVTLAKDGRGAAYYTHNLRYFTRDAFIPAWSEGFTVEREYFRVTQVADAQGVFSERREKVAGPVRTGDLLMVRLTVSGREEFEYVVLEDPLPAGCEAVAEEERYRWDGRREVRDERIVFFTPVFHGGRREITYFLRAETPGRYQVLPARASLMYLPEIQGGSADDTLVIEP